MIKRLLEKLNLIKQQKPKLVISDVIDSNFDKTKIVKVKIKYPCQFEDIVEEVDINVPVGLLEEDEDKFIDDVIERDYAYLYGRQEHCQNYYL